MDDLLSADASLDEDTADFEAVALAVLQLVVGTPHAAASRDRLDEALRIEHDGTDELSDLYEQWNLPSSTKWPRIISRTGEKWFATGREWLRLLSDLLLTGVVDQRANSPFAERVVQDLKARIVDPSNVELRNLIACQGVVLAKNDSRRLLDLFDEALAH